MARNKYPEITVEKILEVAQRLFLEKGYAGIFFVFDEFSKFLDTDSSSYSEELRTLQEVYELCNNTGFETQIHICSIIHKPISYYAKNKSQTRKNNFKTIEGRVKELFFNRSVFENFNLIEHAILKRRGFDVVFNAVFAKHKRFWDTMELQPIVYGFLQSSVQQNCFPRFLEWKRQLQCHLSMGSRCRHRWRSGGQFDCKQCRLESRFENQSRNAIQ